MSESDWRFLSRDPLSGAVEHYKYDEAEDRCIIRRTVDHEPVIEANKRLASSWDGWNRDKSMARGQDHAEISWSGSPSMACAGKNHKQAVRRLLNNNEYECASVISSSETPCV
jgi:hypothetical protein